CVKRAISEKGTYKLEEFDKTYMLGTYSRNQLKKFVKRKGFYKPVEGEEEEKEEEDQQLENEVGNDGGNEEEIEAKIKPTGFEIRLPMLTAVEQSKYVQYKEDEDGNML